MSDIAADPNRLKTRLQPVRQFQQQYREALLGDVVPWWLKHSLDREHGGYYSLLERDGRL